MSEDWQMKFIGEEQRHRDTKAELALVLNQRNRWEEAYWALVRAAQAVYPTK